MKVKCKRKLFIWLQKTECNFNRQVKHTVMKPKPVKMNITFFHTESDILLSLTHFNEAKALKRSFLREHLCS